MNAEIYYKNIEPILNTGSSKSEKLKLDIASGLQKTLAAGARARAADRVKDLFDFMVKVNKPKLGLPASSSRRRELLSREGEKQLNDRFFSSTKTLKSWSNSNKML